MRARYERPPHPSQFFTCTSDSATDLPYYCGFAHKVKAPVMLVKEERWVVLGLLGVSERTQGFESLLRHQAFPHLIESKSKGNKNISLQHFTSVTCFTWIPLCGPNSAQKP